MVIIQLDGGLGNQMFQYAFGKAVALTRGERLVLLTGRFRKPSPYNTPRSYALDCFALEPQDIVLPDRLSVWVEKILRNVLPEAKKLSENESCHSQDRPPNRPLYFSGYWQDYHYFQPVTETLRRCFTFPKPLSPTKQQELAEIRAVQAVGVHIRRGDYLSKPETAAYHGLCPPAYYAHALKLMTEKTVKPHFFFFSDDPKWVQDNVITQDKTGRHHLITAFPSAEDWEDLQLMAACRHQIIANSTFSWWGAWLNNNPDKLVIAPQNWFAAGPATAQERLIYPEWLSI